MLYIPVGYGIIYTILQYGRKFMRYARQNKILELIKENDIDIEDMSTSDLVKFITNHPTVLKRPIIIDGYEMQTGYDEEQISVFKRNDLKKLSFAL